MSGINNNLDIEIFDIFRRSIWDGLYFTMEFFVDKMVQFLYYRYVQDEWMNPFDFILACNSEAKIG